MALPSNQGLSGTQQIPTPGGGARLPLISEAPAALIVIKLIDKQDLLDS